MKIQWRNDARSWGAISKFFHWSVAVLMIYGGVLAIYIVNQDPDVEANVVRYITWIKVHKSVGLTVFLLAAFRIVWLKRNPRPDHDSQTKPWERFATKLTHGTLYGLMFVLPIIGFCSSNSVGAKTRFWSLFEVPAIFPAERQVAETFSALGIGMPSFMTPDLSWALVLHTVHWTLGYLCMTLVVLHVAAALFHHFVRKDAILTSMLSQAGRPDFGDRT